MKKSLISLAVATLACAAPSISFAADTTVAFNAAVASDYRYRGISQSRLKPAVSAGVDVGLPNGVYVGAWASSIKWIKDAGGDASAEIDVYGGWKGEVSPGLTLDVGALTYQYPSNKLAVSANTTEIYGALSFDVYTLKYSHSVTNLFGFADSKNSGYLDLSATFDAGNGVMVAPHVGYQKVSHNGDFSYTDVSLTVSKDYSGFVPSLALVATDTKSIGGVKAYASPANGKNLGKTALVLGLKYNF